MEYYSALKTEIFSFETIWLFISTRHSIFICVSHKNYVEQSTKSQETWYNYYLMHFKKQICALDRLSIYVQLQFAGDSAAFSDDHYYSIHSQMLRRNFFLSLAKVWES